MLLFTIHTNSPALTRRLPYLSCITRNTKFCLANFAAFMIIRWLFDDDNIIISSYSATVFRSKELCKSKICSKSTSILLWKVCI